ncbi:27-O-demethylrifamycin SV methyltransferase [Actinomadura viridis]|uniref:SAM-dependent methyltransferase n=1 Tax=Actinomadura viridis TaxID=58110 RepID=A0A931DRS2_9ACTN|nr:class I SAM-dependent methyltransferase [Actinomadura viridis]MBG6091508.1 SAM-dependent methyltransferase [Actinomadura viridis]
MSRTIRHPAALGDPAVPLPATAGDAYGHLAPLISRYWGPDMHYGLWDGPDDDAPFPVATERLTAMVIERLGVTRADRVLDVGCGNGRPAAEIARRYEARVVGVDIDPAALARAREHAHARGVGHRVMFLACGGPAVPFADGAFQAALAFESTPHFDLGPLFAELSRVLAPGGRLVVETPCLAGRGRPDPAVDAYLRMLGGRSLETVETHRRHARRHGLSLVDAEDITGRVAPSFHRLAAVLRAHRDELAGRYGPGRADALLGIFDAWAAARGVQASIMTFAKTGGGHACRPGARGGGRG